MISKVIDEFNSIFRSAKSPNDQTFIKPINSSNYIDLYVTKLGLSN